MSPILVLAGVGVLAVAAAVTLAVLIIGIRRETGVPARRVTWQARPGRTQTLSRAALLLGVRYPESVPRNQPRRRWPDE